MGSGFSSVKRTKHCEIFCASMQSVCIEQKKVKLSVIEISSFPRNPSATSSLLFNKRICSIPELHKQAGKGFRTYTSNF